MTEEIPFAKRLLSRMNTAINRDEQVLSNNKRVVAHIQKAMPTIDQTLGGNEASMIAIREAYGLLKEAYGVLEADAEALSETKAELSEAVGALEVSNNLLEQAGFDFKNIQTAFGNDEAWFGNHFPTIKRIVNVVNLDLFEMAFDEEENERFEDIAHAVKRSGKKREARPKVEKE
mgnify:FL=1